MKWEKKGLIYCPRGDSDWMDNSVLTPQPFLLMYYTCKKGGFTCLINLF